MYLLLETTYRFGACFFLLCKRVEGRMSLQRASWPMVVLLWSQAPSDSSTVGLVWEWNEGFWASWTLFWWVCVCVQDWAKLLRYTGLWSKEEESCSAPPALCLQKVVASPSTFRGRHTSSRAYESMFLPPAKGTGMIGPGDFIIRLKFWSFHILQLRWKSA